jgi:predicted transcriptional regulator
MSDSIVYKITELGDSIIPKGIETMDEWLILLSQGELDQLHSICSKESTLRSDDEEYEISRYAIILYCRELEIDEISITDELINQLIGYFCVNVILENLRRKGMVTASPLLLYKDSKVELTDKGKEFAEKNNEQGEN